MVAEEVWQLNQGLREAVLSLQRRSEEHDKIEQELRAREAYFQRRCEDLERCLSEKTSQLEEEIQSRKATEDILRNVMKDAEKKAQDSKDASTVRAIAALFAHEVANSLNGIFACLQLLDMKAQDLGCGDPELQSLVGSATEEIKRLGALLKDFRSFSQPQHYAFEATDLRKMIDKVIAGDRLLYDSVGVRLKVEFPDTLLSVTLDQEKIKHAILSICKNAVEAMPSGGVLTFRGYESEGRIFLEIGDTGAGIPKGLAVFAPFRTTKPCSSGLGLPIVSQIISAHNGTIDYVSDLGKGTTFKIGLPAGRPQPALEQVDED
jgi:signal transduction histidine kinase